MSIFGKISPFKRFFNLILVALIINLSLLTNSNTVMNENSDVQFVVIENTEKIQAVKLPDGRIAASFIKSGSFSYNGETYSGKKGEVKIFG